MYELGMSDLTYVDRHCETDEEKRILRKIKRMCKVKQIGGDDGYHYCFIFEGRVMSRGDQQYQAYCIANRKIKELCTAFGVTFHQRYQRIIW